MKKIFLSIMIFIIALIANAQGNYTMDKNHSKVGFRVANMGITHVKGEFTDFTITLVSKKEDFTDADIEMTASSKSIETGIKLRDTDLRGKKWFDAEKYPTLTFKSTSFKKNSDKNYKLIGNISMHGITKVITLDVVYNGKVLNPMTQKYAYGFTITGKLNRKDFLIGSGFASVAVSDEVELNSTIEFIQN